MVPDSDEEKNHVIGPDNTLYEGGAVTKARNNIIWKHRAFQCCHNAFIVCWLRLSQRHWNGTIITPPRKDAVLSNLADSAPTQRDRHIKTILDKGRAQWQYESGYGQRNLLENSMYRIKTIYGGKLKSRNIENQKTESRIILNNINIMTGLGMPESYAVGF